ncbi:MAG: hypothetical protein H6799_01270 [Candidatus Nomurabacteria bacterium]|nr:MAG: hypothetical protein H6799_01270 [Candidatus Nomurabacteria bacterium]HRV75919.1 hypothetical protein [Candidatus Saccharimonadales bacterium]
MKKRDKGLKQPDGRKEHPVLGFIVIAIIIFIVASAISGGKKDSDDKSSKTSSSQASTQDNSTTPAKVENTVSQDAAEKYCQDAALLGKYIDLNKISIIKVTAYDPQFNDSGTKASNGDTIYDFQWIGQNKETKENVLFVCSVSGTDDNITLHNLAISGQVVYGPVDQQ